MSRYRFRMLWSQNWQRRLHLTDSSTYANASCSGLREVGGVVVMRPERESDAGADPDVRAYVPTRRRACQGAVDRSPTPRLSGPSSGIGSMVHAPRTRSMVENERRQNAR